MCCLFHRGWPWGFWAGRGVWRTGELLPREPLASPSSYAENCLGNSYKNEGELKKLNSLDFASRLQHLGQWTLPSSMPAVGTELCREMLQKALFRSLWITASKKCCSPVCTACFVELSHVPRTSMTQESKTIIILEKNMSYSTEWWKNDCWEATAMSFQDFSLRFSQSFCLTLAKLSSFAFQLQRRIENPRGNLQIKSINEYERFLLCK